MDFLFPSGFGLMQSKSYIAESLLICQYSKVEMSLDSFVALMIDRTDIQVRLQDMESLLYDSDYIIEFPDVQFLAFKGIFPYAGFGIFDEC